jgi:hypothetical protein
MLRKVHFLSQLLLIYHSFLCIHNIPPSVDQCSSIMVLFRIRFGVVVSLEMFGGTDCERPCDVGCASECVGCGCRSVVIVEFEFEFDASAE